MDCQLSTFIYTKIKVMKRGAWASPTTVISSFGCSLCTMPVSRHSCEDPLHQVYHKTLQTVRRMSLARGEGNALLLVTAADTALDALDTHVDENWLATDWNTAETTDGVPVSYDFLTFTHRTAQFVVPSLHI